MWLSLPLNIITPWSFLPLLSKQANTQQVNDHSPCQWHWWSLYIPSSPDHSCNQLNLPDSDQNHVSQSLLRNLFKHTSHWFCPSREPRLIQILSFPGKPLLIPLVSSKYYFCCENFPEVPSKLELPSCSSDISPKSLKDTNHLGYY